MQLDPSLLEPLLPGAASTSPLESEGPSGLDALIAQNLDD